MKLKKILFFSRDPGGANAICPLVCHLREKYLTAVYAKDMAVAVFGRERIEAKQVATKDYQQFVSMIQNEKPDIVITGTSADDLCERYVWEIARTKNIPSIAILDHWCNYGIRFSRFALSEYEAYSAEYSHDFIPDKIAVMDDYAKIKLMEEKIPEERVAVTGQPHFEWIQDKMRGMPKQKKQDGVMRILYVSEPYENVYGGRKNAVKILGYSEKTIFEELLHSLKRLRNLLHEEFVLKVKLHPKEDRNAYVQYLSEPDWNITCEKRENLWEFLPEADLVCGMVSMLLIESYLCGKNVLSIQIGKKGEQKFILDQLGAEVSAYNSKELDEKIKDAILLRDMPCRRLFKASGACVKIQKLVEEII